MLALKRVLYLLALSMSLSLTGCISFHPLGPVGEPDKASSITSAHVAQVADVVISAPGLNDDVRKNTSRVLTEQISHYVESAGYYKDVITFPAKLGEKDVLLKFNLTSLNGRRTPHPGYVPGALVTLTIWIWVNGPVYVDTYDLAGELTIEDRDGKTLAKTAEKLNVDHNVGIYDTDYMAPGLGSKQLRELIAKLLDTATTQLNTL
jgi:hypothetical protein